MLYPHGRALCIMQCDLAEELLTDVERMDKILGACDCEGLFSDFLHELSKREREARRNERKHKSEAFKSLIEGYEVITFATRHKELPEELEKVLGRLTPDNHDASVASPHVGVDDKADTTTNGAAAAAAPEAFSVKFTTSLHDVIISCERAPRARWGSGST